MLRSVVDSCHSVYTCLCLTRTVLNPVVGYSNTATRCLHNTARTSVLHKDQRAKKDLIKMSQESKMDRGAESEINTIDSSLGSSGHIAPIPTLDTHNMLINGIRYDELPVIHIHCSPNNTIITMTDYTGKQVIGRTSCGQEGFRNTKKSSTVAAQATGMSLGYTAMQKGAEYVRVAVKGVGSGRLPSLKGINMAGVKIVSITDRTPLPSNGPRPRKARRI